MNFNERFTLAAEREPQFIKPDGSLNYSKIAEAISVYRPVSRQAVAYWATGNTEEMGAAFMSIFCMLTNTSIHWLALEMGDIEQTDLFGINEDRPLYEVDPDKMPVWEWGKIHEAKVKGVLPRDFMLKINIKHGELANYEYLHAVSREPVNSKKTAYIVGELNGRTDLYHYISNGPSVYLTLADPSAPEVKHEPDAIQALAWVIGGAARKLSSYPS